MPNVFLILQIFTYVHLYIHKRYLPKQNKCANSGKQGKNQQAPEQLRPEKYNHFLKIIGQPIHCWIMYKIDKEIHGLHVKTFID